MSEESFFWDAHFYDCFHAGKQFFFMSERTDISLWLDLASKYGDPILELGCGTGRTAIPLAEAGFQVTGIDISDSMLEFARQKSSLVNWVKGDMCNFDLNTEFSLITLPYFTFNILLELEEAESCLACVRRHLQSGGKFAIDLLNPYPRYLNDVVHLAGKRILDCIFPNPQGGGSIIATSTREYDVEHQIATERLFYHIPGREEVVEDIKIRLYFPQEIEILLKYNGFKVESKFGDYQGNPFTPESLQQILICEVR
ncbi:MAG: methyltransferase domain-containing protein [Fischerella sp.]|nr:methyltransferase domain-containing protein [Fischerella sp.]